MKKEISRSPDNAIITGVCAGIAARFEFELWIVRLCFVLSALFLGFGILAYIIFTFSFPVDTDISNYYDKKVLGVCARIAKKFDIEVGIIRSIFAFCLITSLIPSFGTTLIIYIILNFIIEDKDEKKEDLKKNIVDVKATDIKG